MPTKVLVFENDPEFAEELERGLQPLGCQTTIVQDATAGLELAAREKPDLILLAIELPRMNGFSVCNRLKRDPGLKDVPLIILSSESSDQTFEQHRRLRTRAEDYVHKPVAFEELLNSIQALVPLGPLDPDGHPSVDEILVEDDIEIEDVQGTEGLEIEDAEVLDGESDIERLADQAFESIQSQPPPGVAPVGDLEFVDADVISEDTDESLEEPASDVDSSAPSNYPSQDASGLAGYAAPPETEDAMSQVSEPDPAPPAAFRPSGVPISRSSLPPLPNLPQTLRKTSSELRALSSRPPDTEAQKLLEELDRNRARINQLEEELRNGRLQLGELEEALRRGASKDHEVRRLQRELDDAKAKLGSSKGASSAREFLDLREQLNRKDRENLDLRDQLTFRDKELVALRETTLALERERADLLDRAGELERQGAELQKRDEALRTDKEVASKRADEFKRKADKLKLDLEAKTAEYAELKLQFDAEIADHSRREAEAEARAQLELEKAVLTTEATERSRSEQLLVEAVEAARAEHAQALNGLRATLEAEGQERLRSREAELTQSSEALRRELERAHQETIAKLFADHENALALAAQKAASELNERERELEGIRSRELDAAAQKLQAERAALEDAKSEVEKRNLRIEGLNSDLGSVREELVLTRATLEETENTLAENQSQARDKDQKLAELEARLRQTSERLATVEVDFAAASGELDQTREALARDSAIVARAREKLESDRGALERAKDALAAALAQVDEIESRKIE